MSQLDNQAKHLTKARLGGIQSFQAALSATGAELRRGKAPSIAVLAGMRCWKDLVEERLIRPGGQLFLHSSLTAQAFENSNQTMLRGAVKDAVNGKESAREFYCSNRIIALKLLPAWVERHIRNACINAYRRVDGVSLIREMERVYSRGQGNNRKLPTKMLPKFELPKLSTWFLRSLNLDGMITYADAQVTISRINSLNLDRVGFADRQGGDPQMTLAKRMMFAPTTEGPIGAAARESLRYSIDYMLRARVVIDYLTLNHIAISECPLERIVNEISDPWAVSKSRSIRNILILQDAFDGPLSGLSRAERIELFQKLLRSSDPIRDLIDIYGSQDSTDQCEERLEQCDHRDSLEDQREFFEAGISETIHQAHAWMPRKEIEATTRRLYALHRRGACSYVDVASAILDGENLQDMLDRFYARIKTIRTEQSRSDPQVEIANSSVEPQSTPVKLYYLDFNGRAPFLDWLTTLDRQARERIEARLERFGEGNPGDFKGLRRGLMGIREARLAFGPHYRIYMKRTAPQTYMVIYGGTKATQDQDIRRAGELLATTRRH